MIFTQQLDFTAINTHVDFESIIILYTFFYKTTIIIAEVTSE